MASSLQHTVTLDWTASTSSVSGYNVYRGTVSSGPYTQINTALDASTNYVDNTVTSGTTFFYVVTSVNSSRVESTFSNQVSVAVPKCARLARCSDLRKPRQLFFPARKRRQRARIFSLP